MKLNIFGKVVVISIEKMTDDCAGCFEPSTYKIKLDSGYDEKLSTFWHEFFHAVFFRIGMHQTDMSKDTQEILVENFSVAVVENLDALIKISKKLEKMDKN